MFMNDSYAYAASGDHLSTMDDASYHLPGLDSSETSHSSRRRRSSSILKTQTLEESLSSMGLNNNEVSRRRKSSVSFDIVQVREHSMMLDDSRQGLSLTMEWKCCHEDVMTVQEFDCCRKSSSDKKDGGVRYLTPMERMTILIEAGYAVGDLCDHIVAEEKQGKTVHPCHYNSANSSRRHRHGAKVSSAVSAKSEQDPQQCSSIYSRVRKAAKGFRTVRATC
ncbi:expressed unknown protein [Seminavis robusta]|uniref:Uncharacterized protein n=1 Tax=Seminavis robusta TaxID=568900 RepID=A0A9N8DL25_9STRA|nr:expressed unknown protein [Seminavis robusta]|eukprot:Sro201_g084990.1 n/a (222) ;mRNA; r:24252-24917